MHAVHAHGDADLDELGGMKKFMPITNATFGISCLAIAGFPLTSGFFSKDMILHGALTVGDYFDFAPWLGYAVFGALCAGAFTTAFYMFRLYFLTFTGEFRGGHGHGHDDHGHGDHGHGDPHESEKPITFPLMVLALGALVVGFLGMPAWAHLPDWWSEWLHPVLGAIPGAEEHHHDAGAGKIAAIAGTLVGLGGIGLAWSMYKDKAWHSAKHLSPLHQLLMDKWRVDELYNAVLIRPMTNIAVLLGNVDRYAVDGLTKLAAFTVSIASFLFTRMQTGVVHAYGAAMALGLVGVTWWVTYPHAHISSATKGPAAHLVAGNGLGYEYRWDFDSDGKFETAWSKDQRDVEYAFDPTQMVGVELKLIATGGRHKGSYSISLHDGQEADLSPRHLGDGWRTDPESTTAPQIALRDKQLLVRPGASSIRINGTPADGTEIPVPAGAVITFGQFTEMRVDVLVKSTLEVRNAFGNISRDTSEFSVEANPERSARVTRGAAGAQVASAAREGR
jgi:hypothetical protein